MFLVIRLLINDFQNEFYNLIELSHIFSAHAYNGHVARYFPIIGETLHRWGKRILSHGCFLCNQ